MGNKLSKVGKSGRVLTQNAINTDLGAKTTRLSATERSQQSQPSNSDSLVAERLMKLGPVQFKQDAQKYQPASEDKFTVTLEARQKLEDQSAAEIEKGGLRKLLPPQTITAILLNMKEGDSEERIKKAYRLDDTVLPRLKNITIPEFVKSQANELLNQSSQPVRRRKKSE